MKVDEPSAVPGQGKSGDISPISGPISGLPESSAAPTAPKRRQPLEPSSETLYNFSRVTPSQLAHIIFPPDGRYQPVRPVATSTPTKGNRFGKHAAEKYAGGGGILLLIDKRPYEPIELLELGDGRSISIEQSQTQAGSAAAAPTRMQVDDNAPEADPPEPFEVCPISFMDIIVLVNNAFSIPLIMILKTMLCLAYYSKKTVVFGRLCDLAPTKERLCRSAVIKCNVPLRLRVYRYYVCRPAKVDVKNPHFCTQFYLQAHCYSYIF